MAQKVGAREVLGADRKVLCRMQKKIGRSDRVDPQRVRPVSPRLPAQLAIAGSQRTGPDR